MAVTLKLLEARLRLLNQPGATLIFALAQGWLAAVKS